ncbi:MAG TPA: DinB family protein [Ignavibacteria bacterium]|nr:DinB family protein [Ignavibacteria bacterium]HQY52051.1 DinB family protein [Ignavibacteria bacterium]HRA99542.1 DinB family protein [Ignavibacteria bacterium]
MKLIDALLAEFQYESQLTRNMLDRLPDGKFDYKPHEKSMTLGQLANHIGDIPNYVGGTLDVDELDFSNSDYKIPTNATKDELVKAFDESVAKAIESFKRHDDDELMKEWTMKDGDKVYMKMPKAQVIRGFVLNHNVHHRGQLQVYLRMNDIPLPSVYGPTADEQAM